MCLINDGIEDTEHFLLLCSAYDIHIRDLLDSVNAILRPHGLSNPSNKELMQIFLYGHEKLPFDSNTNILEATLKYIQALERFQLVTCMGVGSLGDSEVCSLSEDLMLML